MPTRRAHIVLPDDLIHDIDQLVGSRGRSAFLVETARNEVRRRKLLEILRKPNPIWKDKNHPELTKGSYQHVRAMRDRDEALRQTRLHGSKRGPAKSKH
ncbi:MAG: hypothetical protein JOZ43_05660 [Acidobacteriales bacterium]|nr:hypothetical protein [Terriglobales bacterium]